MAVDANEVTVNTDLVFKAAWGASPQDVFAVGTALNSSYGAIYHYNGTRWRRMNSATYRSLGSVWGASGQDVYAVGYGGTIVHFNGDVWAPMASLTDEALIYVNGTAAQDVFCVGARGGVFHYDGVQWDKVTSDNETSPVSIRHAWGDAIGNLYATDGLRLLHFDGRTWTDMAVDSRINAIDSVWGAGGQVHFWGIDEGGIHRVYFHDGGGWQEMASWDNSAWGLVAASGTPAGKSYILNNPSGRAEFFRHDGNSWTRIGGKMPGTLKGLWGRSETDIFAVGEKALALYYDGNDWRPMDSGTEADLNDVWSGPSGPVIAVGAAGTVLRYDDDGPWTSVDSGTEENLNAVWGDSAANVYYIAGDGGTVLRYDGETCTPMASGTDHDLTGIWVGETGKAYAVGEAGTFLVCREGSCLPVADLPDTSSDVGGIWGASEKEIYLSMGWSLYRYDGTQRKWSDSDGGAMDAFHGQSARDVFGLESGKSFLHHFDGEAWTYVQPDDDGIGLYDVWSSENGVFVVGEDGTILHADRLDQTRPRVLSVSPAGGATDVKVGDFIHTTTYVEIRFSEPMSRVSVSIKDQAGNPVSCAPGSFLSVGESQVAGWTVWGYGTTYTVTVSGDATDMAGNTLGTDYTWSFTTKAAATPTDSGVWVTPDLWIRAQINTGDKGEIEGRWKPGGEDTTERGDRVIWGYFYADPADVSWGNPDNPDLFVKIWFDMTGSVYISYFHVSVPEIKVWSSYPGDIRTTSQYFSGNEATLSNRHVGHFYYFRPETSDYLFKTNQQFEDGRPPVGDTPSGAPSGYRFMDGDMRIGAVIHTEDKGPIEGIWRQGGQGTTQRGDRVVWGYFYADPNIMRWGSPENPDLFVKAWHDVSGAVFLDFFHVSVPDIAVFSEMPVRNGYDNSGTTTLDNRFIEHRYVNETTGGSR
jgi:hypothetical protein